jgi:hypothetical protein
MKINGNRNNLYFVCLMCLPQIASTALLSRLSCALQHNPLARALGMKSARLRDAFFGVSAG